MRASDRPERRDARILAHSGLEPVLSAVWTRNHSLTSGTSGDGTGWNREPVNHTSGARNQF